MSEPPTLDELRAQLDRGDFGHTPSRFKKSVCPTCGALVTNQAMGRKAHRQMHIREQQRARECRVTDREVIRCGKCKLVQFKGKRVKCPRCGVGFGAVEEICVVVPLRPAPAPVVAVTLGQRVKAIRERCGASQRDIAERMQCARQYISKIENDFVLNPDWRQVTRLAQALGCSEADLLPPLKPMHAEETKLSIFMAELTSHAGQLDGLQWIALRRKARELWKVGGCRVVIVNSAEKEAS